MSFQPAVCTRELCVFSFYTLGVMSGAVEDVATGAEVIHIYPAYIYTEKIKIINCIGEPPSVYSKWVWEHFHTGGWFAGSNVQSCPGVIS